MLDFKTWLESFTVIRRGGKQPTENVLERKTKKAAINYARKMANEHPEYDWQVWDNVRNLPAETFWQPFHHWANDNLFDPLYSIKRQGITHMQSRDQEDAVQMAKSLTAQYPQFKWTVRDEIYKKDVPLGESAWITDFNGNTTLVPEIGKPITAEMIRLMVSETVGQNELKELKYRLASNNTMSWLLSGFIKLHPKRGIMVAGNQLIKPLPESNKIQLPEYVHHASTWIPLDQLN